VAGDALKHGVRPSKARDGVTFRQVFGRAPLAGVEQLLAQIADSQAPIADYTYDRYAQLAA